MNYAKMGQHIAMVRAMKSLQMEPSRTYSIDIPYTANSAIVERLLMEKIPLEVVVTRNS
jgi:hypothetical protein